MKVVDVDFNAIGWDRPGEVFVLTDEPLALGERVVLEDEDGNRADGLVLRRRAVLYGTKHGADVQIDMTTWRDG